MGLVFGWLRSGVSVLRPDPGAGDLIFDTLGFASSLACRLSAGPSFISGPEDDRNQLVFVVWWQPAAHVVGVLFGRYVLKDEP